MVSSSFYASFSFEWHSLIEQIFIIKTCFAIAIVMFIDISSFFWKIRIQQLAFSQNVAFEVVPIYLACFRLISCFSLNSTFYLDFPIIKNQLQNPLHFGRFLKHKETIKKSHQTSELFQVLSNIKFCTPVWLDFKNLFYR